MNAVIERSTPIRQGWFIALFFANATLFSLFFLVDPAFWEFLAYFLVYINILLVPFIFNRAREPLDILEPHLAFILLYTLYSWSAAFSVVYYDRGFASVMGTYYACIIIGLVGFMLGYRYVAVSRGSLARKASSLSLDLSYTMFFKILLFLTLIVSLINYRYLASSLDINNIRPYTELALRSERTSISGLISFLNELSLTLVIATALYWTFVKRRVSLIACALICLLVITSVMAGNKGLVTSVVTVFFVYRNYYVRRIRVLPAVVAFALLLVFATMINHIRSTTNLIAMYNLAIEYIRLDPSILLPFNSGEFSNPPQILLNVIQAINSGQMDYSYGRTWLTEILVFVPKIFFYDRPLPMSELYVRQFLPHAQAGSGVGWFIPAEGYWAFGYAGVLMLMLAYGMLLSLVYRAFKANMDNGAVALLYGLLFFPLITTAVRTGFFGTIKTSITLLAPFLIILLLSRRRGVLVRGTRGVPVEA